VSEHPWFELHAQEQRSPRLRAPCVLCGQRLSPKELKQVAALIAEDLKGGGEELAQLPLSTLGDAAALPRLLLMPSVLGLVRERDGALTFEAAVSAELDLRVSLERDDEVAALSGERVELWRGDRLRFSYEGRALTVRVECAGEEEEEPAPIAERPISDVGAYADRLLAEGAAAPSAARLHLLFKHSALLGQSVDLDDTLRAAARFVFDLLPRASHVAIALKEEDGCHYPVVFSESRAGGRVELPMSRTLIKRVSERKRAMLLMDASREVGGARSVLTAGLYSVLVVPLWVGAEVCGVLQVDNRAAVGVFGAEDLELLTVAASTISFAAESARLVRRLRVAEEQLKGGLRYLQHPERREVSGLIGESEGMRAIALNISRVKDLKVPVFIHGETGTGKELIARALHYQSARREALFVAQNCSALPESLLESELFGHAKGAFTGADRDKKGLFELADGGSVFLDEVGEMPPALQAKLLRALQEGEVWPIGAPRPKKVDVRVISATHRDLAEMVRAGTFRQDLFYRLHVYPVHLPPLRERGEDVALLARAFLRRYSEEFGRAVSGFSEGALRCLRRYSWPGNVRELQNEVQRALISRFEGDLVLEEDLSPHISGLKAGGEDVVFEALNLEGTLKEMMDHLELALLRRALEAHGGSKTQTARALGITREGLHKKLSRLAGAADEGGEE